MDHVYKLLTSHANYIRCFNVYNHTAYAFKGDNLMVETCRGNCGFIQYTLTLMLSLIYLLYILRNLSF